MSQFDSQLNDDELIQITETLASKGVKFTDCELCGHAEWSLLPSYISPVIVETKDREIPSMSLNKAILMLLFTCKNCGNAKMLEAKTLGVSFPDKDAADE